jgi:Arginase family
MRYGPQYGPDITSLGVDRCDWSDGASYSDADVVILGAPFDGGTSYRSGTRFGPQYIRQACYLPHDGSRPSLALRVDGLRDLRVYDAGDVEMFSGDAERSAPGAWASEPGPPMRSLPAEAVELPVPHAAEKGMPLIRRELQDRPSGIPAVANADLATGQARHLDAVTVGITQRALDPVRT